MPAITIEKKQEKKRTNTPKQEKEKEKLPPEDETPKKEIKKSSVLNAGNRYIMPKKEKLDDSDKEQLKMQAKVLPKFC